MATPYSDDDESYHSGGPAARPFDAEELGALQAQAEYGAPPTDDYADASFDDGYDEAPHGDAGYAPAAENASDGGLADAFTHLPEDEAAPFGTLEDAFAANAESKPAAGGADDDGPNLFGGMDFEPPSANRYDSPSVAGGRSPYAPPSPIQPHEGLLGSPASTASASPGGGAGVPRTSPVASPRARPRDEGVPESKDSATPDADVPVAVPPPLVTPTRVSRVQPSRRRRPKKSGLPAPLPKLTCPALP